MIFRGHDWFSFVNLSCSVFIFFIKWKKINNYIFVKPVMFQVNIIMLILVYALDYMYTKLLISV